MSRQISVFYIVVGLLLAFLLSGCNKSQVSFAINFDSNHGSIVESVSYDGINMITIPDNPTKEGFVFDGWFWDNGTFEMPFTANSLIDTPIESDLTVYAKWLGFIYHVENNQVVITGDEISRTTLLIPDFIDELPVSVIAEGAFRGKLEIVTIHIGNNVTTIGKDSFRELTNLENIVISSSVTDIGHYAFANDNLLESVYFEKESNLTSIGLSAFDGCNNLSSLIIPESVQEILVGAIPSLTVLYAEAGTIPSGWMSGWYMSNSPINWGVLDYGVYEDLVYVVDSFGDVIITGMAYESQLSSFTIPNEIDGHIVNKIGKKAFYESNLIDVNIPKNVTVIEDSAFWGSEQLESIIFEDNSSLISIGNSAFGSLSALLSIEIPNNVIEIGGSAFANSPSLVSVYIPSSVSRVGMWVFGRSDNLTIYTEHFSMPEEWSSMWNTYNIPVVWGVQDILNINNVKYIITQDYSAIVIGSSIGANEIIIPNRVNGFLVSKIGEAAFKYSSISSIEICESVTEISKHAFFGATFLERVEFTGDSALEFIGVGAFQDTVSLSQIILPKNLTEIGNSAFKGTISLLAINIPAKVTSLGIDVFYGATALKEVSFDNGSQLSYIGARAFENASSLVEIVIPEGVNEIAQRTFYNTTSLKYVLFPSTIMSIGDYAFSGASSLSRFRLPEQLQSIGQYAFSGCNSLTNLFIPSSVTSISNHAFNFSLRLTLYTENTSKPSGWESYWNSNTRETIYGVIGDGITLDFDYVKLSNNNVLIIGITQSSSSKDILVPLFIEGEAVTAIAPYAFYNEIELMSMVISSNVTRIGEYAFSNASSITSLIIPRSVSIIGAHAFDQASLITIYAESETRPSGWDINYNPQGRPVIWGYIGD